MLTRKVQRRTRAARNPRCFSRSSAAGHYLWHYGFLLYVAPGLEMMLMIGIGYGTNFIGGTGDGQSDAAWLIPICIQLLPAIILAVGMVLFMPQSPRHLMNRDREEECLATLARLRSASTDDLKVRIEFLEIKAQRNFERERLQELFPQYQDGSFHSNWMLGWSDYKSLVTSRAMFKRTIVAVFTMVFQQWNGVCFPDVKTCAK